MLSVARARVFSETSIWMAVPLTSAVCNGKLVLASALLLTLVASRQHWRVLMQRPVEDAFWHNLDRLGVVLVLMQVDAAFWPLLALLFAAGAVLQRMRIKTRVFDGGAGKETRMVMPFWAQRWHYWCHLTCRYVAFFACCFASGHLQYPQFPKDDHSRLMECVQVSQMIIYSTLYLIHIHLVSGNIGAVDCESRFHLHI